MVIDDVLKDEEPAWGVPGAWWGTTCAAMALAALTGMTGCSLMQPQVRHVVQVREVKVPVSVPVPVTSPADAAGRQLLAWSEELRALPNEALVQEAARLGDGSASAAHGMRLALVLGLTRNPGDLSRAQQVLEGVLRRAAVPAPIDPSLTPGPATAPVPMAAPSASVADAVASVSALPLQAALPEPVLDWLPWARWLQGRYQVERRMEDQIERQAAQLREGQRKQDQLAEKLEALKAIERQLVAPRRSSEARPR